MKNLTLLIFLFPVAVIAAKLKCPDGQFFVKSHFRKAYTKSDGTAVSATTVRPYCKLLSKGAEYLQKKFKSGLPTNWPHKSEKPAAWTEHEKQRLIEIIDELPDAMLIKDLDGIYRASKSKDGLNPATNADGVIVLYDTAFVKSRHLGQILVHELAHRKFNELKEDEKRDYGLAAGWTRQVESPGKFVWEPRKNGYVEEDGPYSREEDFSNNIEYFLYNPAKLNKTTPGAYEWIEKHYGKRFSIKKGG